MSDETKRLTLRTDQRIGRKADFDALYQANTRRIAGPLLIYARPNGLEFSRLGMAVSRRVGNAVSRNAIRRRVREAFRTGQHDLPPGYDFVVSVRPHELMKTQDYRTLLLEAAVALDQRWKRKTAQDRLE